MIYLQGKESESMGNEKNIELSEKLKKACIGGGMPVALVAGKRDILKLLEDRSVYLTAPHNDADIDFTLDAYQRSLEKILAGSAE